MHGSPAFSVRGKAGLLTFFPASLSGSSPACQGFPAARCLLAVALTVLSRCSAMATAPPSELEGAIIPSRLSPVETSISKPPAAAAAEPCDSADGRQDDDTAPCGEKKHLRRLRSRCTPSWRFTLAGRAIALLGGEIAANAAIWIVAGIVFGRDSDKRGVLSLCVVAWTLGLRHALGMSTGGSLRLADQTWADACLALRRFCTDMDHICAIDNGEPDCRSGSKATS